MRSGEEQGDRYSRGYNVAAANTAAVSNFVNYSARRSLVAVDPQTQATGTLATKLRSAETSVSAQTVYTPKVEVEIVGNIPEDDDEGDRSWFGKTLETTMLFGLVVAGVMLLLCGGCLWHLKSTSNKLRAREQAHHKRKVPKHIKPPKGSNDVELLRVSEGNDVTREEAPGSR